MLLHMGHQGVFYHAHKEGLFKVKMSPGSYSKMGFLSPQPPKMTYLCFITRVLAVEQIGLQQL